LIVCLVGNKETIDKERYNDERKRDIAQKIDIFLIPSLLKINPL